MCIIALKPKGCKFDRQILKESSEINRHGYGIAIAQRGYKLLLIKDLEYEKVINQYEEVCEQRDEEKFVALAHFRIATHGVREEKNIQPFIFKENRVMAHNGTMYHLKFTGDEHSDSYHFGKRILEHLPNGFIQNKGIMRLLHFYIKTSRVVVMNSNGEYYIFNSLDGEEKDGIWYSKELSTQKKNPSSTFYSGRRDHSGTQTQADLYQKKSGVNWSSRRNTTRVNFLRLQEGNLYLITDTMISKAVLIASIHCSICNSLCEQTLKDKSPPLCNHCRATIKTNKEMLNHFKQDGAS